MSASEAVPPTVSATPLRRAYARLVFYPTLLWNCLLGRWLKVRRWWDPIDPQVYVGGYPFPQDARKLHALGVRAVVNTCEEYGGPMKEYERLGITQLRIPTTDFTHPALPDVRLAVNFIQRHVDRGEKVYIHCKAGRARSATVALCWLIQERGLTANQAQSRLLAARPHVHPNLHLRPVVTEFETALRGENKTPPESTDPTMPGPAGDS